MAHIISSCKAWSRIGHIAKPYFNGKEKQTLQVPGRKCAIYISLGRHTFRSPSGPCLDGWNAEFPGKADGTLGTCRVHLQCVGESVCRSRWRGRERMGWDVLVIRGRSETSRIGPEALTTFLSGRMISRDLKCSTGAHRESWDEKHPGCSNAKGPLTQTSL